MGALTHPREGGMTIRCIDYCASRERERERELRIYTREMMGRNAYDSVSPSVGVALTTDGTAATQKH